LNIAYRELQVKNDAFSHRFCRVHIAFKCCALWNWFLRQ
jgi:hypothetical protein